MEAKDINEHPVVYYKIYLIPKTEVEIDILISCAESSKRGPYLTAFVLPRGPYEPDFLRKPIATCDFPRGDPPMFLM